MSGYRTITWHDRGYYLATSDAGRAKQVLAKQLRLSDSNTLDLAYANFRSETPRNIELSKIGGENIITNVAPPGAARGLDAYIDFTVWDDLSKEGFFDRLAARYKIP